MVGMLRLDNLQDLLSDILVRRIPGDVIETGVWRGGASIFMRAVLKAHGDLDRIVWVADSFQGLPKPNARLYPKDEGDSLWTFSELAIPIETVKANFARYEMLDDNVRFLPGWFADTLPAAPIERLSLMRLDGDLYESTMDALRTLYPKLSPGGYVVIDDYRNLETCRAAVDDYRSQNGISEPIRQVDWTCVYWQRLQ
jgi:O-methyltransferase